jgi:hypothetical protein
VHNGQVDTRLSRTGDIQIEYFKDGSISKFKVEWLDSCRYRLTYLAGDQISKTKDLEPVIVQITGVKENSYTIEG